MAPGPTRRQTLSASGASLLTALAGCLSGRAVERGSTLAPPDGASGDAFGRAVGRAGRWTLVGAPGTGQRGTGAAYLFDTAAGTEHRLAPGVDTGAFGNAVALDDRRAVVGAPATADPGIDGSVTVFAREGDQWHRETHLAAPAPTARAAFGYDVALSGTRLVVGARATDLPGATDAGVAHVYERGDGGWAHRGRLVPEAVAAYDYAGGSVAADGGTALLGSFLADTAATDAGSAAVFERTTEWGQRTALTAPDAGPGDRFGNAVALAGDRALVGAVGRGGSPDAAADRGGAYVFAREDGGWAHRTTLSAPDDPDAAFGVAVALDGDRALVGAFSANGTSPGRAVLFERGGDGWRERATLRPADGAPGDGFGSAVALAGDRAVVGSVGDGAGTATLFEL